MRREASALGAALLALGLACGPGEVGPSAPEGATGPVPIQGRIGELEAKDWQLARALIRAGATVQALLTPAAATFVGPATFEGLTGRSVPADVFSPTDHAPHIHLAREADVAVFAPATANLLAKLAVGLADDLVTSTALMLDCPVVVAPAMHTEMWEHPAVVDNIATLRAWGVHVVDPESARLAGGDVGAHLS